MPAPWSQRGQTYILNGHTYTLSDVAFHGKGTAEVNADVQNQATDTRWPLKMPRSPINGDVKTDENGGGVGVSKSINGGFGMVLDGSDRVDRS